MRVFIWRQNFLTVGPAINGDPEDPYLFFYYLFFLKWSNSDHDLSFVWLAVEFLVNLPQIPDQITKTLPLSLSLSGLCTSELLLWPIYFLSKSQLLFSVTQPKPRKKLQMSLFSQQVLEPTFLCFFIGSVFWVCFNVSCSSELLEFLVLLFEQGGKWRISVLRLGTSSPFLDASVQSILSSFVLMR